MILKNDFSLMFNGLSEFGISLCGMNVYGVVRCVVWMYMVQ